MVNVCNSFPRENLFEISVNMYFRLEFKMHVAISMAFWSLALSSRLPLVIAAYLTGLNQACVVSP